jgi:hypothetical protein
MVTEIIQMALSPIVVLQVAQAPSIGVADGDYSVVLMRIGMAGPTALIIV